MQSKQKVDYEFIIIMALLMSLVAFSIDAILPALTIIGLEFQVSNPNHSQLLVSGIFLGLSCGVMVYGPLSDTYGRKKIIYLGIFFFVLGNLISLLTTNFKILVLSRVLQGFGVASCRIVSLTMIRDKFSGPEMAKIMSLIMMFFILVPTVAPLIGTIVLMYSSWRAIIVLSIILALIGAVWLAIRQKETLKTEDRVSLSFKTIWKGVVETVSNARTRVFTLAAGLISGAFIGYLSSSQQIFQIQYGLGDQFSLYFGVLALVLGVSSYINAKLVMKFQIEKICLFALSTITISSFGFLLFSKSISNQPPLYLLMFYLSIILFCLGMTFGNFNTLAIEPLGHIAGVANSVISSVQTFISVGLGAGIGYLYDGTIIPLCSGFLILGLISSLLMIFKIFNKSKTA
ncbi:MAG: multidrug effflux MFS transporter [Candidatus Cloacimonetes bacterium]|nr:multidrug effflux MFS transporter [Candidatus Cloacimonadota bacterium]